MKTSPWDFILSGLILLSLSGSAILFIAFIDPALATWLGDFHILAAAALFLLLFGLGAGLITHLLIRARPLQAGDYAMEHPQFTYWKLLTVIYEFGRGALLPFTTVFAKPGVEALFGAKLGTGVALGGRLAEPYLITVEAGAVLGHNSVLTCHAITSGQIILRGIRIGARATVGVNVIIMPGVEIGAGAIVAGGSVVPMNTKIPAGELWGGIPARKLKDITPREVRA